MRILIACGGTAGHIFPGLALAEELKKEDTNCQITIVVSTQPRDKEYLKSSASLNGLRVETINASSLPYGISLRYISFTLSLIWACLQSFYIVLKYRPEVIVGFGGYISFAPVIVARLNGIPALIHEQNLIPGRANRLLARVANKIAITFDDTNRFFPGRQSQAKIVKTGLPLRRDILNGKGVSPGAFSAADKFVILILGGSQGAHKLNELALDCFSRMSPEARAPLDVIHLTGKKDFHCVCTKYAALGMTSRVFNFLEDISSAYRIANLLISRSGANTIFEAAIFGLPSILIPYSYAGRHQKENALFLKRLGAALVLDEQSASATDLEQLLQGLINNKSLQENLSQKIKLFKVPEAAYNLKQEVCALCRVR